MGEMLLDLPGVIWRDRELRVFDDRPGVGQRSLGVLDLVIGDVVRGATMPTRQATAAAKTCPARSKVAPAPMADLGRAGMLLAWIPRRRGQVVVPESS